MDKKKLKINSEFETIIQPMDVEEFAQLEQNILKEGRILDPIIVWNGTIVDGHNRYKIAARNPEIEFEVVEKQFTDKAECLEWICNHQLGRRNLDSLNKKYLIGRMYRSVKEQREAARLEKTEPIPHVGEEHASRKVVADKTNTTPGYVRHAGDFATGLDLAEEVVPGTRQKVLKGEIKVSAAEVSDLIKVPEEKREQAVADFGKSKQFSESEEERRITDDYHYKSYMNREPIHVKKGNGKVVDEEAILEIFKGAVCQCIKIFMNYLKYYPRIASEKIYRDKFLAHVGILDEYMKSIGCDRHEEQNSKENEEQKTE